MRPAQCSFSSGVGPNLWGGQVSCAGQTFWVADAGDGCASLSVTGVGYATTVACQPNGASNNNATGMCLDCLVPSPPSPLSPPPTPVSALLPTDAELAAYCVSQGVSPKDDGKFIKCCIAVVTERWLGRTVLTGSSCDACQDHGVCPETNKKWSDITKNRDLGHCRTGGKVDNDSGGTAVTWCKNDSGGLVALIVCLAVFVFACLVALTVILRRRCIARRQQMGAANGGVAMQVPMTVYGRPQVQMGAPAAYGGPPPQMQTVYGQPVVNYGQPQAMYTSGK